MNALLLSLTLGAGPTTGFDAPLPAYEATFALIKNGKVGAEIVVFAGVPAVPEVGIGIPAIPGQRPGVYRWFKAADGVVRMEAYAPGAGGIGGNAAAPGVAASSPFSGPGTTTLGTTAPGLFRPGSHAPGPKSGSSPTARTVPTFTSATGAGRRGGITTNQKPPPSASSAGNGCPT